MAIIQYITPTQPSGSIGGITFYKNGGQIAMRSRVRPCIPTSNARTLALNSISALSMFWEMPLTNSDRIGWGLYAFNTPLLTAWNTDRYIRGYAHYLRANRPRYLAGLPRVDTPPSTFGLPTYTLPTFDINQSGQFVKVGFNAADDWATTTGGYLFLWFGMSTSLTRTKPTEIYTPFGVIAGDNAGITSPINIYLANPTPGTPFRYWFRSSASNADGRLSGQ